jgi:hypothetical protein
MAAGGSAEQMEHDALRRAEHLRQQAAEAERQAEMWAKGREGEERVAELLDSLGSAGVRAVHDRSVPGSDANHDHLVAAPSGIYVIDAKNWSGTVSTSGSRLWQNDRNRDEVVDAAMAQAAVVQRLVDDLRPPRPIPVRALVCFAGDAHLGRPERLAAVDLVDLDQLADLLLRSEPQLAPVEVDFVAQQFASRLTPRAGYTEEESRALPMQAPAEPVVFLTRWTRHGSDRLYVMDEEGIQGGFLDLRNGEVLAEMSSAEPILRRLMPLHLDTTSAEETTEETRGVIAGFLGRGGTSPADLATPAIVVGRTWQRHGKHRLYVHWLGPAGESTDLGWFDLKDRRVEQAAPSAEPIVRYCGETYLACRDDA